MVLGTWALAKLGRKFGLEADDQVRVYLSEALAGGMSANAIAGQFNEEGVATVRGGRWSARSILNLIARLDLNPYRQAA